MIDKIRRWLQRMGIINNVKLEKKIDVPTTMYDKIAMWKNVYQGYHPEWHNVERVSIDGVTTKRIADSMQFQKLATEELASLVFNEKCEITTDNEALNDYLHDKVFRDNAFYREFQRFLEYGFALGGFVVKPYIKGQSIGISFVKADSFIPLRWDNKGVYEGVFINENVKNGLIYTHLEIHEWLNETTYTIKHELYERDKNDNSDTLGVSVAITKLYPNLNPIYTFNNAKHTQFVYIKSNIANNIDLDSPLGVSVFNSALGTIRALDDAFDSFRQEFKLGRKRILVSEHAIKAVPDFNTGELKRSFNYKDDVYEALAFESMDNNPVKEINSTLRVDEHIAAINMYLNIAGSQIGFSEGTFSFDGKSIKTATEVVSENARTFRTKQSHEVIIEESLKQLVDIIVWLSEIANIYKGAGNYEVTVAFNDAIAQDDDAVIDRQAKLLLNGITSKKLAIAATHKVPYDEAQRILDEIKQETVESMPEYEEVVKQKDYFGELE